MTPLMKEIVAAVPGGDAVGHTPIDLLPRERVVVQRAAVATAASSSARPTRG